MRHQTKNIKRLRSRTKTSKFQNQIKRPNNSKIQSQQQNETKFQQHTLSIIQKYQSMQKQTNKKSKKLHSLLKQNIALFAIQSSPYEQNIAVLVNDALQLMIIIVLGSETVLQSKIERFSFFTSIYSFWCVLLHNTSQSLLKSLIKMSFIKY